MRRVSAATVAIAAAALLGIPGVTAAQEPGDVRVGITYTPGYVPGLVMPPVAGDSSLNSLAVSVDSIVRRDLEYSDRFEMITAPDSLSASGTVNYALWNQLGAVWLVHGELVGTPQFPVLRLSLHDVVFGEMKEVEAFSLPPVGASDLRIAVHRVSDTVVKWATGDPGIAATRIAFRRKLSGGGSDIFMVDSDGVGLRRVTFDSSIVYSPAISPDGSSLLYVSYKRGEPDVFERQLLSGRTRLISAEPGLNITPVYSADGRRILLARTAGTHTEVFSVGRDPLCCSRRLTFTSAGDALNPAASPDGRRFAFTATPLGQPQIYVQGLEGSTPDLISRYVFGEKGYATSPDWSPRGDRIAYHGWIDGVFQVITVNPDGSDRRVLTSSGSNEDPSWAPDGRHLVFASDRNGSHALWILDAVSGRVRSLTVRQVDQMPDWSAPLP